MQPKYICDACLDEIQLMEPPFCLKCGLPLVEGRCRERHEEDYFFDSARAVGVYDGVLRDAVHKLKYSGHQVLAPILADLLIQHLKKYPSYLERIDCIVPVSIHPSRLKQRRFNQSELLAIDVSRAFSLPLVTESLVRTRKTSAQFGLSADKRRENVEDAFEVVNKSLIDGRIVLLIDDVLTTGSTANESAKALKDGGAKEVHVLTVARDL